MITLIDCNASTSARPNSGVATDPLGHKDEAITLRTRAASSSFFWAMQLLSYERREATYALCDFCREVDDIADGGASRSLKQTLLLNWRSEIALLYSGRPRHAVTCSLNKAIHLYGLRCDDFLAIIDGMEMDARADIRAPSLVELDLYCERVAVAVGRLSVRIFGERVQLARASQPNSGAHCSSPTYFATSPRMPGGIGCICRASYCKRTAFTPLHQAGYWRSRPFAMSAATSPDSRRDITVPP
jgi:hypothetical protein